MKRQEDYHDIDIDELIKNLPEVKPRKSMLPALVVVLTIITIILIIIVNFFLPSKKANINPINYHEVL